METVINGLKTFLKSKSLNPAVDLNQQKFFNVRLSARIKIPCDILSQIKDSNDWLQEMQFLDISFQEEGSETDFPFIDKPSQFNVAFKQSDGSQRCMEFQNGAQSKNIIIKGSVDDSLASEEVQQLNDGNSLEVLPTDVHQDQQLAFKKELPKIQDDKVQVPDIGIYVDVDDDENDMVKEECEMENNINTGADNSGNSEYFGNTKNDAQDGSNHTPLDDDDDDDEDFDPSIIDDEDKNVDSDESWNPEEKKETKNVIRRKAKCPRGKRRKRMVAIKDDDDFTNMDSETKIEKKRIRKSNSIEMCEELETSEKNMKVKRRRSNRKKNQIVGKEDSVFGENDEIWENQKVKKKWKWGKNKVSCEYCGEQFDQIRAFNIHVETHASSLETHKSILEAHKSILEAHTSSLETNASSLETHACSSKTHASSLETLNSADVKVDSVMRLDATQIQILEAEIEEKGGGIDNQNEVIEIKLVELSEENGTKTGQEEFAGGEELLNSTEEILKKQEGVSDTSNLREQNKPNATENNSTVNCVIPSSSVSKTIVKKDYDVLCCCFCERKFSSISQYNKHIQGHSSERPYVCDQCQGAYKTEETLKIHKLNVHHQKRFPCESCDRSFKYKISLERHFTSNHKQVKPHICHICGKDYYSKSSLVDHIARHSKVKPYKCDVCNQYYHSEKLLSQHKVLHFAVLKHQCDQCGKSFQSVGKLSRHLEQHAPQRNYVCEICQMAFTLKRYYARHKVTHDPQRAVYKCDACFKSFANKTNLDRHKKTFHSDAKPFQCDVCYKAFKLKSLLDQHSRVHKEEKDYSCQFCKKKFSFNSSLHSHIKNHHIDEVIPESKAPKATFKCKICENMYYSKSALVSHYTFHQS